MRRSAGQTQPPRHQREREQEQAQAGDRAGRVHRGHGALPGTAALALAAGAAGLGLGDPRGQQPLRGLEVRKPPQPNYARGVDRGHDNQQQLAERPVVGGQEAVVEKGQHERKPDRHQHHDLHAAPGRPRVSAPTLRRMSSSSRTEADSEPSRSRRPGPRRRELMISAATIRSAPGSSRSSANTRSASGSGTRVCIRLTTARGSGLGQGRRGDPQARPGMARSGVRPRRRSASRSDSGVPDGQALQPGHRPALAGRTGQPAPAVGEDGHAHPGLPPSRSGHQRHDADQRGHRAARPGDAPKPLRQPVPPGAGRPGPRNPVFLSRGGTRRRRPPPRTGWPAAGRPPGRSPAAARLVAVLG